VLQARLHRMVCAADQSASLSFITCAHCSFSSGRDGKDIRQSSHTPSPATVDSGATDHISARARTPFRGTGDTVFRVGCAWFDILLIHNHCTCSPEALFAQPGASRDSFRSLNPRSSEGATSGGPTKDFPGLLVQCSSRQLLVPLSLIGKVPLRRIPSALQLSSQSNPDACESKRQHKLVETVCPLGSRLYYRHVALRTGLPNRAFRKGAVAIPLPAASLRSARFLPRRSHLMRCCSCARTLLQSSPHDQNPDVP